MKIRRIGLYLFLILLTVVTVFYISSCSDKFSNLSPKDSIIKASEKLKLVKAYRMKIEAVLSIKDVEQKLSFTGEVQNPNMMHLSGELMGMSIDIYQKDSNFFIKNPVNGKWVKTNDFTLGDMNDILKTPEKTIENLKDIIEKAEYLNDEQVKGVDCKVIKFIPNNGKIKEILLEVTNADDVDEVNAVYTLWIGKKDLLIYKMNVDILIKDNTSGKRAMNMTVDLYDFNKKDVVINFPPDLPK